MKSLKIKSVLAVLALGAGISMSNGAAAQAGSSCQLLKARCDGGMQFYCQQYYFQCT